MRVCLLLLFGALGSALAQTPTAETITGKLIEHPGGTSVIETADHRQIAVAGDAATRGVITDKRLDGVEIQARGHFTAPGHFLIDPIHTKAILVHKDGRLKLVTYWCDVCSIRTYSPGPCWCCQKETTLDLRDPDEK